MKRTEKIIGLLMLLFAIGFNLWLYRLEPTATTDPNDNTFQYALVDRTNQMWDYAATHCPLITKPFCMFSTLSDHWVPNWAEGYNLPYYYSHAPQIAIVATHRLFAAFGMPLTLFQYYHWVTYLLLSFFPLSLYLALLVIGLSPVTAGFGAIIATQLSTDGLYGLDPSSFLWRGYGLTSQLYAMVFFPFAIAYAWKYITDPKKKYLIPAIISLAATTAGHLGIGIMAFLSTGILAISPTIQKLANSAWNRPTWNELWSNIMKVLWLFGGVGLLLGYWILPILKDGNFHNTSVWDPIWKFDSYGYRIILKNFFNGDLFDFGRFPTLTMLTLIGLFSAASVKIFTAKKYIDEQRDYFPFAILFVAWLLLYFGTTTWGSILYLIPGMSDFHISRFIVGVHMAGLFLIPFGFQWLLDSHAAIHHRFHFPVAPFFVSGTLFAALIAVIVYPQTMSYSSYNDILIKRANTNFAAVSSDSRLLLTTLYSLLASSPGRVFAGRGGSWGKNFRVAETPYYMYLSTYGIPTVLWLPETWSPNSDTEQYFSEDKATDYSLYNIRYVVTPTNLPKDQIQPFWKPLAASKTWNLYEVPTDGYITTGVRPAIVSSTKLNYTNVIRLWIQSDTPKQGLYPELTFDKSYPVKYGLPNFRMVDEVLYKVPDGSIHDLFAENPKYIAPTGDTFVTPKVISQSDDHDMIFSTKVEVPAGCTECVVILKQSFHPSWKATIDGKPVTTMIVFPFYIALKLDSPGTHEVVFSYQASFLKTVLLLIALVSVVGLLWLICSPILRRK